MAMSTAVKRASSQAARRRRPVVTEALRWRGTMALESDDAFAATRTVIAPLTSLTEEETMLKDSGANYSFVPTEVMSIGCSPRLMVQLRALLPT